MATFLALHYVETEAFGKAGLFLLHNDADFDKIARFFPLKIWA